MKRLLIALFVLWTPFLVHAQKSKVAPAQKSKVTSKKPVQIATSKHVLYADIGLCLIDASPGFSVTYNYKLAKRFGLGIGVQGYKFLGADGKSRFAPGLFADIRFYSRPQKQNQFFSLIDLGINFYKPDRRSYSRDSSLIYEIPHNNGFYSGFGFGYFRRMTKHGGGPYVSLKVLLNWSRVNGYYIRSNKQDIGILQADGSFALSFGFKL